MKSDPKIMLLAGLTALAPACASTQATPHLVDARRAYDQVESGKTNDYVPDRVYEAKVALDEAEQAHKRNPGSEKEKHLSYVAYRKSSMAMALGGAAIARKQERDAKGKYERLLLAQRNSSRGALDEARGELADGASDLAAEKSARSEAEQTADAALASLEEIASVKADAERVVITLSGEVLFTTNVATLLPIARDRLDKVAEVLQQQAEGKTITVEGHTDSRGSADHNDELSRQRAESVMAYLVSRGVASSSIAAVGKGEGQPVATNSTSEGRANNRRVEIVIDQHGSKTSRR